MEKNLKLNGDIKHFITIDGYQCVTFLDEDGYHLYLNQEGGPIMRADTFKEVVDKFKTGLEIMRFFLKLHYYET